MTRRPLRAAFVVVLLAVGVAIIPGRVGADDLDDELRRVSERIRDIASQIDDVTASRSSLAADLLAASNELETLQADLDAAKLALDEVRGAVEAQTEQLHRVRSALLDSYTRLSETRTLIAKHRFAAIASARAAYTSAGRDLSALSIATDRISDVSIGVEYLDRVSGANAAAIAILVLLEERERQELGAISEQDELLADDMATLTELEAEQGAASAALGAKREELATKVAFLNHLLETLDEEIAHFEEELDGLEAEQSRLKRRIASRQKAKAAPVPTSGFVRPVPGAITSPFGPRYHPVLGYYRMHAGVDMEAGYGTSIKAAQGGVVILADNWGGYGRTVVIDHGGGMSTLYAHQSRLSVSTGETVVAGESIGKVGTSGLSTGAHLHFEVRLGGEPVNPAPYLGE